MTPVIDEAVAPALQSDAVAWDHVLDLIVDIMMETDPAILGRADG